jgi:hypothetical protein
MLKRPRHLSGCQWHEQGDGLVTDHEKQLEAMGADQVRIHLANGGFSPPATYWPTVIWLARKDQESRSRDRSRERRMLAIATLTLIAAIATLIVAAATLIAAIWGTSH